MSFAREGLVFIVVATLLAAGVFALALNRRSWPLWLLALALVVIALGIAFVFRDPDRTGERGAMLAIAPADGRVMQISEVDEPAFLQGPATRVSIFMNVFDVHVNRYPVSGTLRVVERRRGRLLNAAVEQASVANEQTSVGIESEIGRVLVRQIAGLVARRIETYGQVGQRVEQGDRMGLIRFGSRVDLFLPAGSTVRVKVGETTVAGTTIIGELPKR